MLIITVLVSISFPFTENLFWATEQWGTNTTVLVHLCMDIGIWGDSITYGSCDSEALGWVGRLRKTRGADQDYDATYNYGLCGDTSDNLLSRFSSEFDSNVYGVEIIVFAIGLNDSSTSGDSNEFLVPMERFQKNLRSLIAQAEDRNSKVVLVGLTNVDESRTVPLPGSSTQKKFLNENIRKYDNALREIATEAKIPFIGVFGLLDDADLADGLHPNAQGYEKLFSVIREEL